MSVRRKPLRHQKDNCEYRRGVYGRVMAANNRTTPRDLQVKLKEQRLIVEWMDGKRSEYSLDELRRHCPCATCRTQREEQERNPLRVLKFDPAGVRVTDAKLVGNYAIQFQWSDGHNTGIFDFRYLRALADQGG